MIENVVDEIKETLESKLPEELAVFGLVPLREILIAEREIPLADLPALYILARSTREAAVFPFHDEIHTLWIIVVWQHIDTQQMARDLFRYNRAVRLALMKNLPATPANFVRFVKPIRHDYTPAEETDTGAYTKAVQLEIEAHERLGEF